MSNKKNKNRSKEPNKYDLWRKRLAGAKYYSARLRNVPKLTIGNSSNYFRRIWFGKPDLEAGDPLFLEGMEYQLIEYPSESDLKNNSNPFLVNSIQVVKYLGSDTLSQGVAYLYEALVFEVIDPESSYGALRLRQDKIGQGGVVVDSSVLERHVQLLLYTRSPLKLDRKSFSKEGHESPLILLNCAPIFMRRPSGSDSRTLEERAVQDNIVDHLGSLEEDRVWELMEALTEWFAWPCESARKRNANANRLAEELLRYQKKEEPLLIELEKLDIAIYSLKLKDENNQTVEADCLINIMNLNRIYAEERAAISDVISRLENEHRRLFGVLRKLLHESVHLLTSRQEPSFHVEERIMAIQKERNLLPLELEKKRKKLIALSENYQRKLNFANIHLDSINSSKETSITELHRLLDERSILITKVEEIREKIRVIKSYLTEHGY